MEPEVIESEIVLPTHFSFKKTQMYEKYPKGQARGRHWKHLKQIIQAENYQNYPPNEPNYFGPKLKVKKVVFRSLKTENSTHGDRTINEFPISEFGPSIPSPSLITKSSAPPNGQTFIPDVNIESPPSMHPCKRICDITGFEAPYLDPRTNLRYANVDVFKLIRSLPNEYVQRYLALRNAAVVLK